MPKKIATLLLAIAAIGSMEMPVQAANPNSIDSSPNVTMESKSNLVARRIVRVTRFKIRRFIRFKRFR